MKLNKKLQDQQEIINLAEIVRSIHLEKSKELRHDLYSKIKEYYQTYKEKFPMEMLFKDYKWKDGK